LGVAATLPTDYWLLTTFNYSVFCANLEPNPRSQRGIQSH